MRTNPTPLKDKGLNYQLTPTEKKLTKTERLQYATWTRGVSNSELPGGLRNMYGARVQRGPDAGKLTDGGIRVNACIRFDDDCKNGHCTFSITGNILDGTRDGGACGQITDILAFAFPELEPFLKWHLTSTDGPLHYLGNAVYLAGDRDYNGRRAGEAENWEYGVRFSGVSVTHRLKKSFYDFLVSRWRADGIDRFQVAVIAYPERQDNKPGYKFGPKFTLVGFDAKWHTCPFDDKTEADEFCEALNNCKVEFVKIPTAWSKGKAHEFDGARRAAVWLDATDEELSVEPEELKAVLVARLPALMAEFRTAVESFGFDYEFPA